LVGKPQEAEKITVTTQIVNVDAVVYHKKSGQIVTGLKKENFAIQVDGAPRSSPTSPPGSAITVAMVVDTANGRSFWRLWQWWLGSGNLRSDSPVASFCRSL